MSIRLVLRRGAGLIAAAGLLAGLGGVAPAAQAAARTAAAAPREVGYQYLGLGHVPKSVKRGQSFVVSLWFMERSPEKTQVMAVGVSIFNPGGSSGGVRVDWLDPVTKRWEPSTGTWGGPEYHYLQLPVAPRLIYKSGVWGHVYARITFTTRAHRGEWYLHHDSPLEYQMWTTAGQLSPDYLNPPRSMPGAHVYVH